jgi:hypothetical protein
MLGFKGKIPQLRLLSDPVSLPVDLWEKYLTLTSREHGTRELMVLELMLLVEVIECVLEVLDFVRERASQIPNQPRRCERCITKKIMYLRHRNHVRLT